MESDRILCSIIYLFSNIYYQLCTRYYYRPLLSNVEITNHMYLFESLKYGNLELRCVPSTKYSLDFTDIAQKRKVDYVNIFYIDYHLTCNQYKPCWETMWAANIILFSNIYKTWRWRLWMSIRASLSLAKGDNHRILSWPEPLCLDAGILGEKMLT